MNILISSYTLDLSGVPTYTLTLYNELIKREHSVQVYSPASGSLEKHMNVHRDFIGIKSLDVIIAQHRDCAHAMKQFFPNIPIIFSAHGVEPEGEQPPNIVVDLYTAINEETFGNLVLKGIQPTKIAILRDFVDTERFCSTSKVNNKVKRVLFISNRKKWKTYAIIEETCKKLNLEFRAVGSPYGRAHSVEKDINNADLVIGSGRAILEAMSCGRPVISFDKGIGDGYFTEDVYFDSRTHNFCGEQCKYQFNIDTLADEINKYHSSDGDSNRDIILQEHNVIYGATKLISILRRLINGRS